MVARALSPQRSFVDRQEQTKELFEQLAGASAGQGRMAIIEQIVLLYLDLCTGMANRYRGRGVEHDDLVQVARLGLVEAIRRYEPDRGPSFAAYAVPTVSGEIKKWFRDHGWVVRPPRRVQELRATVRCSLWSLPSTAAVDQEAGCLSDRHTGSRRVPVHPSSGLAGIKTPSSDQHPDRVVDDGHLLELLWRPGRLQPTAEGRRS